MLCFRMRMRRQLASTLLVIVGAATLVAPALALAAQRLHWNETYTSGKTAVMNFKVTSLTVTQKTWTAHVSFENLSNRVIKVGNQFAIAFFASAKTSDPTRASALIQATTFSPARPTALKPGATWRGVIGGTGALSTPKTSGHARILFGPFRNLPGQKGVTYWITNHQTPVAATSVASSGGALVA
jgi:hypothetical protein